MAKFLSTPRTRLTANIVAGLLIFCAVTGFFWFAFAQLQIRWQWDVAWEYRIPLVKGWALTAIVSLLALIASLAGGLLLVLAQRTGITVLKVFTRAYVEIVRGTPLLVHILVIYYVLAPVFGLDGKFWSGIVALSAFSSAYLAEILRGGIDSIAKTQIEAAKAVGFSTPSDLSLRHRSASDETRSSRNRWGIGEPHQEFIAPDGHRSRRIHQGNLRLLQFHLLRVRRISPHGPRLPTAYIAYYLAHSLS